MAAKSLTQNLQVEHSCSLIINTIRSLPLNFNIVETPYSLYVTLRKSLVKNSKAFANVKSESSEDKVNKLEKMNQSLNANLEEAVLECEEKTEIIDELKDKVDILLEKLEKSEQAIDKMHAANAVKESEIKAHNIENKNLVAENKTMKSDLKGVSKDLDVSKLENKDSVNKLERKIEVLKDNLKNQTLETKDALEKLKVERAELKVLKDELNIEVKEASNQTDNHPDIPYRITDPLPPIFSMQLCHKSRPIHFLSRSIPNLNSILWCPPDDEFLDAAEEYLSEQYDQEIEDFYLQAQDQACVQHGTVQHAQAQHQAGPD